MNVVLTGGVPFIREDLPALLVGIIHNRILFSIFSNGGLIYDQGAAFIARTGRCDYVQVSVDGSRSEPHYADLRRGAVEKALRRIHTLQRHGVNVAVRLTIHRHNVGDLEATARFLLEDLGLPRVSTNSAGYLGN